MKKFVFLLAVSFAYLSGVAQFSIATDFTELRNLSDNQKFWASGQTVQGNFHITEKESFYGWLNYFGNGRFSNDVLSQAKSSSILPQTFSYNVSSLWRYHQFSVGWKHYLKGSYHEFDKVSIYSLVGFGLITSKVTNTFSTHPDTARYNVNPPLEGNGIFRKLSLDLGLGAEWPVGGTFYFFTDARAWLPTSAYPSPYMQNTNRIMPVTVSVGLRVLFEYNY